jgi:hypothetical protein
VTFRLTNPTASPNVCKACGKVVKDMSRHAGRAACAAEGRRAMIERLGLVEVYWREQQLLTTAQVPVTVIRDQRGKQAMGRQADRRRWYAAAEPVRAMRALDHMPPVRVAALLRGPKDELERELVVAALARPRRQA